jgi:hypothetical protein
MTPFGSYSLTNDMKNNGLLDHQQRGTYAASSARKLPSFLKSGELFLFSSSCTYAVF